MQEPPANPGTARVPTRPYVIRDVTDPWAMRALEDVQVDAWGYSDREVTPGTLFRICAVMGGIVLAAYPAEEGNPAPVGLAFGFPALSGERIWHHSHLLAVHPDWRASGMAVALKLAQRERAVRQGLTRMTWTFDPLVARNARLNLGKLGATVTSYHADWYALDDNRAAAFPADRLMAEWDLTQPHAERPAPTARGQVALEAREYSQEPGTTRLYLPGNRLLAEVPTGAETLPDSVRLLWRHALRDVLSSYLARGYAITDLARVGHRAYYVLSKE